MTHSLPGLTIIRNADLQRVVINGTHSDLLPVTYKHLVLLRAPSSVPFRHLWYVIMDLNRYTYCSNNNLCRTISSIDDQVALQYYLNTLNNLSKTLANDFNTNKCKVLQVKTPKRHHVACVDYKLGHYNLLSLASQNDLSIMVANSGN